MRTARGVAFASLLAALAAATAMPQTPVDRHRTPGRAQVAGPLRRPDRRHRRPDDEARHPRLPEAQRPPRGRRARAAHAGEARPPRASALRHAAHAPRNDRLGCFRASVPPGAPRCRHRRDRRCLRLGDEARRSPLPGPRRASRRRHRRARYAEGARARRLAQGHGSPTERGEPDRRPLGARVLVTPLRGEHEPRARSRLDGVRKPAERRSAGEPGGMQVRPATHRFVERCSSDRIPPCRGHSRVGVLYPVTAELFGWNQRLALASYRAAACGVTAIRSRGLLRTILARDRNMFASVEGSTK